VRPKRKPEPAINGFNCEETVVAAPGILFTFSVGDDAWTIIRTGDVYIVDSQRDSHPYDPDNYIIAVDPSTRRILLPPRYSPFDLGTAITAAMLISKNGGAA
jgi:hypothetical protein